MVQEDEVERGRYATHECRQNRAVGLQTDLR